MVGSPRGVQGEDSKGEISARYPPLKISHLVFQIRVRRSGKEEVSLGRESFLNLVNHRMVVGTDSLSYIILRLTRFFICIRLKF